MPGTSAGCATPGAISSRFSTGGAYVNFMTEDEGEDRIRSAYGANYARLVEAKTAWDPGNFFRFNKNIQPGR
jgi:hypothetical protein